jgi:starch phosphorylase
VGGAPVCQEMERAEPPAEATLGELYHASVPATRAATDFTARAVPHWPGVCVPLEFSAILWQR